MNGGELLVSTMQSRGVDTIFYVAGGTYITVMEALSRQNAIRAIPTRLESSAVFAAETYAALRRKPACVFVSRAPGATNASIGIHTAMQASRPVVLFVANIPSEMKQREAFQEIDYRQMFQPIAKAVFDVHSFDELAPVAARALDLSVSGRPGPVVVSVSKNIFDGVTGERPIPPLPSPVVGGIDAGSASRVAEMIAAANKPVILAGELVAWEGAHDALASFAEASGAGVLAVYRMQDVMANDHPAYLGQLTLNRLPHIERALDESDLMVAIGSRLDSVTTADYTFTREGQPLVMVHPEPSAFSQWQPAVSLAANAGPALGALTAAIDSPPSAERLAWRDGIHADEAAFSDPSGISVHGDVNLAQVLATFRDRVPENTVVVSDAGTFGRWLHRFYPLSQPDSSLGPVSGAMGYGVPGALGACAADPSRPVFAFVGDGGFTMTGHECITAVQEGLPIKVVVCDNAAWGSILVSQNKRFPEWDYGTRLVSPDFKVLGDGYGMASFKVERTDEFGAALDAALAHDGPAMIHIKLDVRDVSPFSADAK